MQLNKQKGDYECHFLAEIPTDPYRYKKKERSEGWRLRTALVKSQLLCHSLFSTLRFAERFGSVRGLENLPQNQTAQGNDCRREGAGQTGVCVLLPRSGAPNGPGIQQRWHKIRQLQIEARKVQMGNKLQVFNRASNYLPERRSRFTTFQVFQHRRGVFLKKLRSS